MSDTLHLRQRRFTKVQMQAESDKGKEPCMIVADNNEDDGSVFGPYLETCPGKPENRGCYDIQMTTRGVRKLEFQTCMESTGSNQLWQYGNSYDNDFTAILDIPDNRCVSDIEYRFKWSKAITDAIPIIVFATDDDNNDCISFLDTDGFLWVRGSHYDTQDDPFWEKHHNQYCSSWVEGDDGDTYCESFTDVGIVDIVAYTEQPFPIVIDINGFLYVSTPEEMFRFTDNDKPAHEIGACEFFVSNRKMAFSKFLYTLKDSTTNAIWWDYNNDDKIVFTHPDGKQFVNGAVTATNLILIDEDGAVWVYGENQHAMLGIAGGGVISTLTHVDIPQAIVKVIASSDASVSFLFTSQGTVYSAGFSNYDYYNDICTGLLGRPCDIETSIGIGNHTFSMMRNRYKDISVCHDHAIAIHIDGSLWGWGKGYNCGLGTSTKFQAHTGGVSWRPLPLLLSTNNDWADISCHVDGCSAVKLCTNTSGTVKITSHSDYGQLIYDSYNNPLNVSEFSSIPTKGFDFVDVSLGKSHGLYLSKDNLIFIGGVINNPATVGGYVATGHIKGIKVVPQMNDVRFIFAHNDSTAYTTTDGRFFVVGPDIPVVIGVGDDTGSSYSEFTEIPFDSPVVQFHCCESTGVTVLLDNGEAWVWGINNEFGLGVGENQELINPPQKIPGLYIDISVGQTYGAGISISGALMMWGTDNNKGQGWGLFGQGENCDTPLDDPLIPTMTLEVPTLIRPSNMYMDGRPRNFKEVLCVIQGTFVIIAETDTEFLDDHVWGEPYPRWCKGDVWCTGQSDVMTDVYNQFNQGGCWGVIIANPGCFIRSCIESKAYSSLEKAKTAVNENPAEAISWEKDGTFSGDIHMWNSTSFCPVWVVRIYVWEPWQNGYGDFFTTGTCEVMDVQVTNSGSGELWINDWHSELVEIDWEENCDGYVDVYLIDTRGVEEPPPPNLYAGYYEFFNGSR